jgi:hypothetical protein
MVEIKIVLVNKGMSQMNFVQREIKTCKLYLCVNKICLFYQQKKKFHNELLDFKLKIQEPIADMIVAPSSSKENVTKI